MAVQHADEDLSPIPCRRPLGRVLRQLPGYLTRRQIQEILDQTGTPDRPLGELARRDPVVAFADEPLRIVVYRMAETGLTRLPVVEREETGTLVGMISLNDLLHARTRSLEEERRRERVLRIRFPFGSSPMAGTTPGAGSGSA